MRQIALTSGAAEADIVMDDSQVKELKGKPEQHSVRYLADRSKTTEAKWKCKLPPGLENSLEGPDVAPDAPSGAIDAVSIEALPPDVDRKCAALADTVKSAPIPVATAADLRTIKSGKTYVLTSDIALDGEWTPLGDEVVTKPAGGGDDFFYSDAVLSGTVIDGRGHKITGLSLRSGGAKAVGLISTLYCGVVTDLELDGVDAKVSGGTFGALAGYSVNSYVEDVSISNLKVVATNSGHYGSVVGFFDGVDGITAADASSPQVRRISVLGAEISAENLLGGVFGIAKDVWIEDVTEKDVILSASGSISPGLGGVAGGDNGGGGVKIGKVTITGLTMSASCADCAGALFGGVIANTVGAADKFYQIKLVAPVTVSVSTPNEPVVGTVVGRAYAPSNPDISGVEGSITVNGGAPGTTKEIGSQQ